MASDLIADARRRAQRVLSSDDRFNILLASLAGVRYGDHWYASIRLVNSARTAAEEQRAADNYRRGVEFTKQMRDDTDGDYGN